jgi:hypothetical protein
VAGCGRILDHSRQQHREGQWRFGRSLGLVVGLVVLYLVAHHIWPADEPGRVVWAGPLGVAAEWMWWAGIGAAVRGLTTAARPSYWPAGASCTPASRWPSLLLVVSTALLVLVLFVVGVIFRADGPGAIMALYFDRPASDVLVPIAFMLGFFHRLGVVGLQHVARSTWEALKHTALSLPGWWSGFWGGIRAMWQSFFP